MTNQQLRDLIVRGLDGVESLPWIVRRNITDAQMRVIKGMRGYVRDADEYTLSRINEYVEREPLRSPVPAATAPEGDDPAPFSAWMDAATGNLVIVTDLPVYKGHLPHLRDVSMVVYTDAGMIGRSECQTSSEFRDGHELVTPIDQEQERT